ncbi:MAG: hypothetical protein ACKV2T_25450 [Kofleriaceae bacterium]
MMNSSEWPIEEGLDPSVADWWTSLGSPFDPPTPASAPVFTVDPPATSPSFLDHWWESPYAAPSPLEPMLPAVPAPVASEPAKMPLADGAQMIIDQGGNFGSKMIEELGTPSSDPISPILSVGSDTIGALKGIGDIATDGLTPENALRTTMKVTKVGAAIAEAVTGSPCGGQELSQIDYSMRDQYDPNLYRLGMKMMIDNAVSGIHDFSTWLDGGDPQGLFPDGVPSPQLPKPLPDPGPLSWTDDPAHVPDLVGDLGGSPFIGEPAPITAPIDVQPIVDTPSPIVDAPQLPMVVPPDVPPMPDFTAPKPSVIPPSLPLPPEARQLPMVIEPAAPAPMPVDGAPMPVDAAPVPVDAAPMPVDAAPSTTAPSMHLGSAAGVGGAIGGGSALATDLYRKYVLGEDVSVGTMATNTAVGTAVGAGSNVAQELLGARIASAAAPALGAGSQLLGSVAGGGIINGAVAGLTSTFTNAGAVERGEVDAAHATANVAVDAGVGLAAGVAGGLAGAATGAAIGSVIPVAGTALGGAIGATAGFIGGGLTSLGVSMLAEHSGFSGWAKDGLGDALGVVEQPLGVMWSGINGGLDGAANGAMIGGAGGAAMGAIGTGLTGAAVGMMAGGPVGALIGGLAGAGIGAASGGLIGAGLGVVPGAAIGTGMGVVQGLQDWLFPSEEQPGDFS